jgi:hypothetical protein
MSCTNLTKESSSFRQKLPSGQELGPLGEARIRSNLHSCHAPSNTGAEALDSPLSKQVLGERLSYQERQAGFKPAPESSKTDQTSESKKLSPGGVTPGSKPDIEVRTRALVAGDDAEEPVGSDGKASMLAGFPRQGQEGAMDEPGLDDSDDDEPGMLQQEEPQQEELQEASSAAPAEGENASDGACAADAGKEKEALDGKALEKAALLRCMRWGVDDSDGMWEGGGRPEGMNLTPWGGGHDAYDERKIGFT